MYYFIVVFIVCLFLIILEHYFARPSIYMASLSPYSEDLLFTFVCTLIKIQHF